MSEFKTSFIINLTGDLQRRAEQFGSSLRGIGNAARQGMGGAENQANRLGRELQSTGMRMALLATGGLGLAALAKESMNVEQRLEYLGVQANASSSQVKGLWGQINAISSQPTIKVDPKEVLAATEQIIELTGDLQFAQDNVRNLAVAIRATGASGSQMGATFSEFQKMGLGAKQVKEQIESLTAKGKEGAFTFRDFAAYGPRLFSSYLAAGGQIKNATDEIGASMQVIRQATGDSAQATTAFEALMRTLGDKEKVQQLMANGIKVFDSEEYDKHGRMVLRPLPDIMNEITQRASGRMTNFSMIFDAESMRAFNRLASEYQNTGKTQSLQHFMGVTGTGQLDKDAARIAATNSAETESDQAQVLNAVNKVVTPALHQVFAATRSVVTGHPSEFGSHVGDLWKGTIGAPGDGLLQLFRARGQVSDAQRDLNFTERRLAEEKARMAQSGQQPQGKVTIELRAESGTSGRLIGRPEARGLDLDIDSGRMMMGPK